MTAAAAFSAAASINADRRPGGRVKREEVIAAGTRLR